MFVGGGFHSLWRKIDQLLARLLRLDYSDCICKYPVLGGEVTVGGGLEKLSQGRNFFFSMPAPAQLSAYANHEFKIIPIPTQLSAYANHELKN